MKPLCLVVALIALAIIPATIVFAQQGSGGWSQPEVLSDEIPGPGLTRAVSLADPSGRLHVFWYTHTQIDADGYGGGIFYTVWDGTSWSRPTDVLMTPGMSSLTRWPEVALDSAGILHAVWYGDTGRQAQLYYSRVPLGDAGKASAWTKPTALFYLGGNPLSQPHHIVADVNGRIHVLSTAPSTSTWELFYTGSSDSGVTWSEPVQISQALERFRAGYPRLAVDGRGRLHAAWVEFPEKVSTYRRLMYSRSLDGGQIWSTPMEVAPSEESVTFDNLDESHNFGYMNVVAVGDDEIHLLWDGSPPVSGRYHQWSSDGGETWTAPSLILPVGGQAGWPQLVADSAGTLHMISSGDGLGRTYATFYMYRDGLRWSNPVAISPVDVGTEMARVAVTGGNVLHVVWPGRLIRHMFLQTSAPPIAPVPVPVATLAPAVVPTPTVQPSPTATATPRPSLDLSASPPPVRSGTSWVDLFLPVAPVLLLLAGVILFQTLYRRQR